MRKIQHYFPQIPEAYRNEWFQIDILRRTVIRKEWTRPCVAEIHETIKIIPKFSQRLSVSLQNCVDERELCTAEFHNSVSARCGTSDIFFGKRIIEES